MATVYVATTGSNSYTYAQAQNPATPWLTLSKCVSDMTSGDTIYVSAGTYSPGPCSFYDANKSFYITGPTPVGGIPLVTFTGTLSLFPRLFGYISNVRFYNAICSSSTVMLAYIDWRCTNGILNLTRCVFDSCGVVGSTSSAKAGLVGWNGDAPSGSTVTIDSCVFGGTYLTSTGVYGGIVTGRANGSPTQLRIVNSTLHNLRSDSQAITSFISDNNSFSVFYIKNSIFSNENGSTLPFKFNNTTSSGTVNNNCFYGVSSAPSGSSNITSNPLLIDPSNGDFRLRANSPCINTGTLV